MVKDLEIITYSHPYTVSLRDKYSGQVFVTLSENSSPKVNHPQITNNDEFDRYQIMLSEVFRVFRAKEV